MVNVSAHPRGFNRVNRMPNAGSEHFRGPRIVAVDLNNVGQQVVSDVVQSAQKRADERRSGLRSQNRLCCRKTESNVYLDAFIRQGACGLEPGPGEGT